MFDFPFEDSRRPENMFPPILPADEIPFGQRSLQQHRSFPRDGSPFPLHDSLSLYIYVYNNERGTVSTVFDSSPENTGEQKNPENSVNSLRFENRGEKLKFISARTIGIRAISFRKRTSFFRYFR